MASESIAHEAEALLDLLEFWASQVIIANSNFWCRSSTADSNYYDNIIIFLHILNKYEKHPKLKLLKCNTITTT